MAKVVIDKKKCEGCSYCINNCPAQALALDKDGKAVMAKPDSCQFCWTCVYNCTCLAITIE